MVAEPGDWRATLQLRASLAARYRYAEADLVFRAARAVYPDDVNGDPKRQGG